MEKRGGREGEREGRGERRRKSLLHHFLLLFWSKMFPELPSKRKVFSTGSGMLKFINFNSSVQILIPYA